MTVLEVLQSTTGYFQKHNIESPRLNAEHLLAHVLGRKRIELYLEFERKLNESELAPLRDLVKQSRRRQTASASARHRRVLRAHFSLRQTCDGAATRNRATSSSCLISNFRSEIAHGRIVDVGTGSGVIALSLAAKFPGPKSSQSTFRTMLSHLRGKTPSRLGVAIVSNF